MKATVDPRRAAPASINHLASKPFQVWKLLHSLPRPQIDVFPLFPPKKDSVMPPLYGLDRRGFLRVGTASVVGCAVPMWQVQASGC